MQDYEIKFKAISLVCNSLRLRLFIKSGREVSKSFPCNNNLGKEDPDALAAMQNYLNTDAKYWLATKLESGEKRFIVRGVDFELVKEMLAGTPEISSNLTGGVRYFQLVCTSVCGVMRYKRFIVGQTTDMQQIQNCVLSFSFCSWLTSIESCPGKWVQLRSLVLSEANQYIDKLCGWSIKLVRYSNNPDVWVV